MVFDDQTFSGVGSDVRLQSPGYGASAPCYDIEVASSASMITGSYATAQVHTGKSAIEGTTCRLRGEVR